MSATDNSSAPHLPALDGIRGLAIAMVMILHFGPEAVSFPIMGRLLFAAVHLGGYGVDLFFALSGFLITGILLRTRNSDGYLRNFYMRRVLRIFPLYYATLFAVFVIFPNIARSYGFAASDQWWFWLYLQNIGFTFWPQSVTGPNHFWSLAVEEQFYIVWPLIVYWCDYSRLKIILVGAILFAPMCRAILLSLEYGVAYFTLSRFDALVMGALLAVISHKTANLRNLRKYAMYGLFLVPPALISYAALSGSALDIVQVTKFSIVGFLCCCLLVFAQASTVISRVFTFPLLRSLGKYSYAMYVFHPFFINSIKQWSFFRGFLGLFVFFLLTGTAAFISWNLVEKHFLRFKRFFEYHPASPRFDPVASEHLVDLSISTAD